MMHTDWKAQASETLAHNTSEVVRPYLLNDFGREKNQNGVSVIVSHQRAISVLDDVRANLASGLVAFLGTNSWLGEEQHRDAVEIAVGQGESQFDILRLAKSDAVNYDLQTDDLISKLQEYDRQYSIDIFSAETDTIQFRLINKPADVYPFACDVYTFCPDIVDQGTETVEALAEEIARSGIVFLWWD